METLKISARKRREKLMLSHPMFWNFVFRSIRQGQNLPGISKVMDVGYNAIMGRINTSDSLRKRYHKAKFRQEDSLENKWFDIETEIMAEIRQSNKNGLHLQE